MCCITQPLDSIDPVSSQSPIKHKLLDTVYLTSGIQDEGTLGGEHETILINVVCLITSVQYLIVASNEVTSYSY